MIESYNDLKLFSYDELMALVPEGFKFKTKPWKHQAACFLASISNYGFLDNLDLGTGKTKVAIDTVSYLENIQKRKFKVLVVCLNQAVEKWAEEVTKHGNGQRTVCLRGAMDERWRLLKGKGFFIINFEGLRHLVAPVDKLEKKQVIRWDLIKKIWAFGFDCFIVDESHKIKNTRSLTSKIIYHLQKKIRYRYALTGTVFGKSLIDIWPQYYLVDRGETYGTNFYRDFRSKYFVDKGWFKPEWKPTKRGEKIIRDKLWRSAIRYSEDEVDDLPEKVYEKISYDLSRDQMADYMELLDATTFNGIVKNKYHAFRQICGGFMKSTQMTYNDNPKLDLLQEIMEQALETSKIVVFHQYIREGELIEVRLRKMGVDYCILNGRVKDKHTQIKKFDEDAEAKVMIAHPDSGGASIDLVRAAYCAFYSTTTSVIDRMQCEKRIHRGGQTSKRVFYYDFAARFTLEASILRQMEKGIDAFEKIVDAESFKKALKGEL